MELSRRFSLPRSVIGGFLYPFLPLGTSGSGLSRDNCELEVEVVLDVLALVSLFLLVRVAKLADEGFLLGEADVLMELALILSQSRGLLPLRAGNKPSCSGLNEREGESGSSLDGLKRGGMDVCPQYTDKGGDGRCEERDQNRPWLDVYKSPLLGHEARSKSTISTLSQLG